MSCRPAAEVAPSEVPPERPDIVLIVADDLGFSDIGPYGGEIETPALDRLAAGGLRFTQFYNAARCCPTRAALLTGLYPHQAGVGLMEQDMGLRAYQGELRQDAVTFAEALGAAGYGTYLAGKWHLTGQFGHWIGAPAETSKEGWPTRRGFDRFYGTIFGAGSFYDPVTLVEGEEPTAPDAADYYYTDAITDRAVEYVQAHVEETPERPFVLFVSYTAPHWPLHAPAETVARYADRYQEGWDVLRAERHRRMTQTGLLPERPDLSPRDPAVPAWSTLDAEEQRWQQAAMAVYAAQVDRMDAGIGRIVETLEAQGRLDNTLLLFLSDNGGSAALITPGWDSDFVHIPERTRDGRPVRIGKRPGVLPGPADTYQSYGRGWANASNTPFRLYKRYVHEGGTATPLIVHWPARIRPGGGTTDAVGHVIDLLPTMLEAAGAAYPETYEGHAIQPAEGTSLVPVFEGRPIGERALYWEHAGNRAVRVGDWKLVAEYDDEADRPGAWELYDLAQDRNELDDLAARHPARVADLAARYDAWAARVEVAPWKEVRDRPSRSAGIRHLSD